MPTAIETTNAIQDKVLTSIEAGHKAFVDTVRAWSETVETAFSKLPDLAFSEPPKPGQLLESSVSFTEKLLSSQREFATRVFEAAMPATKAPAAAAQATQAAKPASPPRG
jgi:hypothetical protein